MKKGQAIPHALRYLHLNALLLHSAMRTDLYLLQDIIILFFFNNYTNFTTYSVTEEDMMQRTKNEIDEKKYI